MNMLNLYQFTKFPMNVRKYNLNSTSKYKDLDQCKIMVVIFFCLREDSIIYTYLFFKCPIIFLFFFLTPTLYLRKKERIEKKKDRNP